MYLSSLLGRSVQAADGETIGKLSDILVGPQGEVTALVVAGPQHQPLVLDWEVVQDVEEERIVLSTTEDLLVLRDERPEEIALARSVLDKEIVDTEESRVSRINDVVLSREDHRLAVTDLDVGTLGLLRRAGVATIAATLASVLRRELPERLLPWQNIEIDRGAGEQIGIRAPMDQVAALHAADIADIAEAMQRDAAQALLQSLDDEKMADTIEELEPNVLASVLTKLDKERAADVLEQMGPDKAADALRELPPNQARELLSLMEEGSAELRELLTHDPHTAGGRMTTDFIAVPEALTVDEALAVVRSRTEDVEMFYYVYLVEEGTDILTGVVTLRKLLTEDAQTPLSSIAEKNVITVSSEENDREVARLISKYDLLAIPVVDEEGRIEGIVTVDDALEVLLPQSWHDRLPRIL
ncbi:MAG: PRC-barrel domain-containing protein [Dehalococcoidales bacterium]|nr:PRC-barrel domain-containing protein [Dehalococcoidales bacterium]